MGHVRIDQGKLRAVVGPMVDRSTRQAAMVTSARAKANVTRAGRIDTGAMRARITSRRKGTTDPLHSRWQVISPAPYSGYQEFGTRSGYIIRPKRKKALKFQSGGKTVFAAYVIHPGIKGAHFLRDAMRALRPSDWT